MASTYEKIATTTLGSAQATVTFSSISGSYTDIVVIINGVCSNSGELRITLNSDTGSNYSFTQLYGDGSSAVTARDSNRTTGRLSSARTVDNVTIANFQNYSNNTTYKTIITRESPAGSLVQAFVSLWRSTAAITNIVFFPETGTFNSNTTFTLYGIKAA
jgi:hypothetical protein